MSSAASADTALVVPIDVAALCVGEADAEEATGEFAGATAQFTDQSADYVFLGQNVVRELREEPWDQLGVGVHLHWALPDALTRADEDHTFPACPNRWLVTRLRIDGAEPTARSWLVDSDAVSATPPPGQAAVTVPIAPTEDFTQDYAYLGQVVDVEAGGAAPATHLRDLTGAELTAVANGELHFAAYYPSSLSVFGFHDALADTVVPAGKTVRLTYVVIGWFDDPTHDPVAPEATPEQLEAALRWTFAPAAVDPSFSVYSGLVEGIAWNPKTEYVQGQPVQGPIEASGAIGNSPAEALAAYFRARDDPGSSLFEKLLDGLQLQLVDSFAQPGPGQLAQLDEDLHDLHVARVEAGTVHSLVDASAPDDPELIGLPLPLADDLNELNERQLRSDDCRADMDRYRWQVFADWYRIFAASTPKAANTAFQVALHRQLGWEALEATCAELALALDQQRDTVLGELPSDGRMKTIPAQPYSAPADPAAVLSGAGVGFPKRYGGDGRFDAGGCLVCRVSSALLTAATVAKKKIQASGFGGVAAPESLPHAELCTTLLREACLLDTGLAAALTSVPEEELRAALSDALAGDPQAVYTFAGTPPGRVAVRWWSTGTWLPLFAIWSTPYLPLQPTDVDGEPASYTPEFFNANFRVRPRAGGAIEYAPDGGPYSIEVDPARDRYPQRYQGSCTLTPSAPRVLADLLATYLANHDDPGLREVLDQLERQQIVAVPLSGFSDLLLNRRQRLQLPVDVTEESPYVDITGAVRPVVAGANVVGPAFNGNFNPIRAGWAKLSLELVDAFGQRRPVELPELACAESMTTYVEGAPVPSVAYMPPRLAQPSRLLFRWIAADATGLEEMNAHPATTPVCGWLLPSHLDRSLFVYSQDGRPLGTLFGREGGGRTAVGWQSAPGNARTIDQDAETVMRYENPRLRDLVLALKRATRAHFAAVLRVLDAAAGSTDPGPLATNSGIAPLVGSPVALVQALLHLDLQGEPALNLGWECLSPDGDWTDTDAGVSEVELPVVLGDLERLSDGLAGYFKGTPDGGFDLATLYSEAADAQSKTGVVRPRQDTLCVTAGAAAPQRVLMLADPRAPVHATTGILPTAALELPPDQTAAALRGLDMSIFTAPVLRGATGLALPHPSEPGYQTAWVEEVARASGGREWAVTAVDEPAGGAVGTYTPQAVTEGWLRLNPALLEFSLLDRKGRPVVGRGVANSLVLHVTNRAARTVELLPCTPVPEGTQPSGSIVYVHLADLVAKADVAAIELSASGWTFQLFDAPEYGPYWAATPTTAIALEDGAAIAIDLNDVKPATAASSAHVYLDYYGVEGLSDGMYADVLAVEDEPAGPSTGRLVEPPEEAPR